MSEQDKIDESLFLNETEEDDLKREIAEGLAARNVVTEYATLVDPALGSWIAANVCFPSTMVDRITPATTAERCRDGFLAQSVVGHVGAVAQDPSHRSPSSSSERRF